jgi:glutamate synthase (NADPH/NADH) small chain
VVIGGGDTGSDCIGTAIRQGAISVTQYEIMPQPPENPDMSTIWPDWPLKMRTSSSQKEGALRDWCITTTRLTGTGNRVSTLHAARVDDAMREIPGTGFTVKADLVLLAMGFIHPVHEGMIEDLGLTLNRAGNVDANTDDYRTSVDKVFAAGDMRRGQSLVVWAIREGRQCARAVDRFLMKATTLPR